MSENFCSNCGARLEPGSDFCSGCGKHVSKPVYQAPPAPAYQPPPQQMQYTQQPTAMTVHKPKSPGVALVLSVIIPGLGTVYAGKALKGIIIFVICLFTVWFLVGFLVWLYGWYDAYDTANKYNDHLSQYGQRPNW